MSFISIIRGGVQLPVRAASVETRPAWEGCRLPEAVRRECRPGDVIRHAEAVAPVCDWAPGGGDGGENFLTVADREGRLVLEHFSGYWIYDLETGEVVGAAPRIGEVVRVGWIGEGGLGADF